MLQHKSCRKCAAFLYLCYGMWSLSKCGIYHLCFACKYNTIKKIASEQIWTKSIKCGIYFLFTTILLRLLIRFFVQCNTWLLVHIEFLFTMPAHVLFSIYYILKHWIALKARSDWLLKFRLSFANHFWNHIFVLYYLSVLVYTNTITSQYWWWAVDIYLAVVRLCKYHSLATYTSVNSC